MRDQKLGKRREAAREGTCSRRKDSCANAWAWRKGAVAQARQGAHLDHRTASEGEILARDQLSKGLPSLLMLALLLNRVLCFWSRAGRGGGGLSHASWWGGLVRMQTAAPRPASSSQSIRSGVGPGGVMLLVLRAGLSAPNPACFTFLHKILLERVHH